MQVLLLSLLTLATGSAPERCTTPADQTAGWKRVALDASRPALAAPPEVSQFRSGERALVVEDGLRRYEGTVGTNPLSMEHFFRLGAGTQQLRVEFSEPLRGAKVDVTAYSTGGLTFPLLVERRIPGSQLELQLEREDFTQLIIRVHHHFRRPPVVRSARAERLVNVSEEPGLPEALRAPGSLYYLHPGGRTLTLCETPGRVLRVEQRALEEAVRRGG